MTADLQKNRKCRGSPWLAALLILAALALAIGATVYAREPAAALESSPAVSAAHVAPNATSTLFGDAHAPSATTASTIAPTTTSTTSPATTTTIYTHPINDPARVVIPAIGVDSELIPVGMLDDGFMEVPPFGLAGWYELGAKPGSSGPAVIVAHVDTKTGPDVFYHLKDLEPGDEVLVYGEDKDVVTFVVDSKEQQLKKELPVDRIWNNTSEPLIRLITCGGDFDRSSGHYLSNVIVYGHLVK